jgi:hypothetical protein
MKANWFTEDGATTGIGGWSGPDGRGGGRIHYYYPSHQKAEKLMHDFLQKAVIVIDYGPWVDSGGKVVSKQAIIIRADNDKKDLSAALLYQDDSSVLEFSCSCLRPMLAIKK